MSVPDRHRYFNLDAADSHISFGGTRLTDPFGLPSLLA